jgi:Uncharacterised nucleotidyltransferase
MPSVPFDYEFLLSSITLKRDNAYDPNLINKVILKTDWDVVFSQALRHAVFPQVYRYLTDISVATLPPEILAKARTLYLAQAYRNLRLATDLIGILALFESQGIPAIPFKGPLLAAVAYGDATLRQFVDLDILVSRQDMGKVKELLVQSDYRMQYPLTKKQEQFHLSQTCEFTFVHPRLTMLDIHWRFAAKYMGSNLDPETAFARRVPVNLHGQTIYSLAPDDTLLFLCYHGYFHLWSTLGMILDVAKLVKAQEPWDWPDLLRRARDLGIRRIVLLGLSLAGEVLSAPVPKEIVEEAKQDLAVSTLMQQILAKLFLSNSYEPGFWAEIRFHLKARDHLKERVRYVSFRLAIPTLEDWQFVKLPDRYFNLYYLLRPLRLMLQGVILPLQRWFKAQARACFSPTK